MTTESTSHWHRRIVERSSAFMAVLTTVTISIGGLVEIVPMFLHTGNTSAEEHDIEPYTPLQVAGRDIYVREGCVACHSQMVRPMRSETMRYGEWSRSYEYEWDRPFLLGSRRIGPDLHREGGKYPDSWHYEHMMDPRSTSPGSIMPVYSWLYEQTVDPADIQASMRALAAVGTPYTDERIANAPAELQTEGQAIVDRLAQGGVTVTPDKEIVAVIAYLQHLGHDRPRPVAAAGEAK